MFGIYNVPPTEECLTASYVCPSNISFDKNDEVTHDVFFGENIKRVLNALK